MNPLYWRPGQRSAVSIGGPAPTPITSCSTAPPTPIPPSTRRTSAPRPMPCRSSRCRPAATPPRWAAPAAARSTSSRAPAPALPRHRVRVPAQRRHGCLLLQLHGQQFPGAEQLWRLARRPDSAPGKTFFFVNYEGLRHVETMAMVDTVPTEEEVGGDFSQSGVDIYDPTTTRSQSQLQPRPAGQQIESQFIRDQFSVQGRAQCHSAQPDPRPPSSC